MFTGAGAGGEDGAAGADVPAGEAVATGTVRGEVPVVLGGGAGEVRDVVEDGSARASGACRAGGGAGAEVAVAGGADVEEEEDGEA